MTYFLIIIRPCSPDLPLSRPLSLSFSSLSLPLSLALLFIVSFSYFSVLNYNPFSISVSWLQHLASLLVLFAYRQRETRSSLVSFAPPPSSVSSSSSLPTPAPSCRNPQLPLNPPFEIPKHANNSERFDEAQHPSIHAALYSWSSSLLTPLYDATRHEHSQLRLMLKRGGGH
jgi:hypothetical protein